MKNNTSAYISNYMSANDMIANDAFGQRFAALLTENAAQVTHVVGERLRASREQALSQRKRNAVSVQAPAGTVITGVAAGAAVLGAWFGSQGADDSWWSRLGSVVPLIALVAGIWIASSRSDDVRISEIAQVDAALLADELPPAAYADPGFAQFLRDARPADLR